MKILINLYKANDCLKIQHKILSGLNLLGDTIFVENSPEDYKLNEEFLNKNNTPYIKNYNSSHTNGVQKALDIIEDDYVLILDQDCFLRNNPMNLIISLINNYKVDLFGDVNLCRGFQKLKPRICPWFCLVNNRFLIEHNIKFVNWDKVKSTNSESYYDPFNIKMTIGNYSSYKYDVGSTMFEDMYENCAYITSFGDLGLSSNQFYIHIEGSSWQNDPMYKEYGSSYAQNKKPIIDSIKKQLNIQ